VTNMLTALSFSLSVTGPVFLIILMGLILKRAAWLTDSFAAEASGLIFKLFLPLLLFFNIVQLDLARLLQPALLGILLLLTLLFFVLFEFLSGRLNALKSCRGEFCQAGFRGNLAFMGLAFCEGAYPNGGLAMASVFVAILTISYNVLSVITLQRHLRAESSSGVGSIITGVIKNPLIIGISLALILNPLGGYIPVVFMDTGRYISQLTLPLALLCVGASLQFRASTEGNQLTVLLLVSLFKLLLIPVTAGLILWFYGVRDMSLGIAVLLLAAPTATASYVMVVAMNGDSRLAANLVAFTTLCSLLSVSIALFVLHGLGVA